MNKYIVDQKVMLSKFTKGSKSKATNTMVTATVVQVISTGGYPDDKYVKRFHKGRQLGSRTEESYVLKPDGSDYCWPLTSRIQPLPAQTAAAPAPTPPSPGTKVTEEKQPDGSTIRRTVTEEVIPPALLENDFIICLDDSASMDGCTDGAIRAFNEEVEAIRAAAAQHGMKTPLVTLWTFGNGIKQQLKRMPIDRVEPLTRNTYRATGGSTPLFDCVCMAIDGMLSEKPEANPNLSMVLHVITDGGDNASHRFGADGFKQRMRKLIPTDRWSMAFMVPRNQKDAFCRNFALDDGSVIEWDNTNRGAAVAASATNQAVGNFMAARSAGEKSVKKFYLQPDLSKLTATDFAKLKDLSSSFKLYEVKQEAPIKEFIEGMSGGTYVIGSAYYQLVKKEKIQHYKGILLRDRMTKRVYGGLEARKLIGLPHGQEATVEPGNHAQFDIFGESTSVNRKLPRGSLLLHDFRQTVDKQPTWDHTAVGQSQANV